MKTKNFLIFAAFAGFAYWVIHRERQRKIKEREAREFLHFQIF